MSNIEINLLEGKSSVTYYKFMQIFNSFDIHMKRNLIIYFDTKYNNHNYCKYFSTEINENCTQLTDFLKCENIFLTNNFIKLFSSDKIMADAVDSIIKTYYSSLK